MRDGQYLTVSQITALIKENLESRFAALSVEGEISNCKVASSGHLYFSLKDEGALIQAVMFRFKSRQSDFVPQDGTRVRVSGSLTVYPPRGNYQLMVETMHRAGTGDILARLDALRRSLAAEGLFDPVRKRPLPRFPSRVAVITSDKGAALRDILNVLGRRNSGVTVTILPAAVQGVDAPAELVARLIQANRRNLGDVIIIGRGGGSIEDLLAFSDERLVRAVAASRIPVISAVGHETDTALIDFAADYRAPTPSAAAELVSESRQVVMREILQLESVLAGAVKSALARAHSAIARFEPASIEAYFMRTVSPLARRESEAAEALARGMRERLLAATHRVALASRVLHVASPEAVLGRGFSLVRLGQGGRILRSTEGLEIGDALDIRLAAGSIDAEVKRIKD